MTTEQLKNWIKAQRPEFSGIIQLGGVNANADKHLGIYPAAQSGPAHICIGGTACTTTDTLKARLLLRWGESLPTAESKVADLWGLFYGLAGVDMDGATVCMADPGAAPVPLGRDSSGVFEYVINLTIIYKKE